MLFAIFDHNGIYFFKERYLNLKTIKPKQFSDHTESNYQLKSTALMSVCGKVKFWHKRNEVVRHIYLKIRRCIENHKPETYLPVAKLVVTCKAKL